MTTQNTNQADNNNTTINTDDMTFEERINYYAAQCPADYTPDTAKMVKDAENFGLSAEVMIDVYAATCP